MEFESDLKPKGRFQFLHNNYNSLHHDSERGNVNLILGESHQCADLCIDKLRKMEENVRSFDRDIRLNFIREGEPDYSFKLNAVSRKILFKKNLSLAFGVSFIVSSIVMIITLIYSCKKLE